MVDKLYTVRKYGPFPAITAKGTMARFSQSFTV